MSTPRLTFAQRLAGLPLIGGLLSMSPIRGRIAMLVMAAFVTLARYWRFLGPTASLRVSKSVWEHWVGRWHHRQILNRGL